MGRFLNRVCALMLISFGLLGIVVGSDISVQVNQSVETEVYVPPASQVDTHQVETEVYIPSTPEVPVIESTLNTYESPTTPQVDTHQVETEVYVPTTPQVHEPQVESTSDSYTTPLVNNIIEPEIIESGDYDLEDFDDFKYVDSWYTNSEVWATWLQTQFHIFVNYATNYVTNFDYACVYAQYYWVGYVMLALIGFVWWLWC